MKTTLPDMPGDGGPRSARVRPEDLVDVDDLDPAPDRLPDGRDELRPEDRLHEDSVVLPGRRSTVWSCESCFFGSFAASKTFTVTPLLPRDVSRGLEHRRVVAVGDRERQERDARPLLARARPAREARGRYGTCRRESEESRSGDADRAIDCAFNIGSPSFVERGHARSRRTRAARAGPSRIWSEHR